MNRTPGIGLLVFGIVLAIVGAIMRFAVEATAEGFDIHQAGVILLLVGVGVAVVGLTLLVVGSRSRSTITESIRETPSGQVRIEERSDSGPDL